MGSLISLTLGKGLGQGHKTSHCRASYTLRSDPGMLTFLLPTKLVIKKQHGARKSGLGVPRLRQSFSPIRNLYSASNTLLIVPNPSIFCCF